MKIRHSVPLAILSAALLAACAPQRMGTITPPPSTVTVTPTAVAGGPAAASLPAADMKFVALAAGAGMYEVEAARLAASRAGSPEVRAYAQMLLEHHTASHNELVALLRGKGHRIVAGLPPELQQRVNTLSALSGAAFDREFVRTTGVQDHKAAIAAFEEGSRTVTDSDLKAYIGKSLPVLRSHLQQAESLAGRMAG